MAMLNIPSQVDDPQYRYKMPRLITKKESRGKGSKTCIVNMGDVAGALKRPPQYVTKWFSNELGALTSYTNKDGEGERAIVNGHHDTIVFQGLLDKFIEKYVCCEHCHLPEIFMVVRKGVIQGKCMACGWKGELDNTHKLATFIQRNPPDKSGHNIQTEIGGGGKIDRKAKREARGSAWHEAAMKEDTGDDAVEVLDTQVVKEHKHRKEKNDEKETQSKENKEKEKKEKHKEENSQITDKKMKKEKTEKHDKKDKKEKKQIEAPNPKEMDEVDDDKKESDVLKYGDKEVETVVSTLRAYNILGNVSPEELYEEMRMNQLANCFDDRLRLYITLEVVCGGTMNATSVMENKNYISKMISQVNMPQAHIIWAINAYVHMNPDCLRSFAPVLKVLYDEDWAEERAILEYYNDDSQVNEPGFEEAKRAAAPFLKWLQIAETDEDSEENIEKEGNA